MRPETLRTRIFLDSGDPGETEEAVRLLGFLDGQTTNPSLVAKSPEVRKRLEAGERLGNGEVLELYQQTVQRIASLIPKGAVSIEVYADPASRADGMLRQARSMYSWVSNGNIKFPSTREGLRAAEGAVAAGMRVNLTLCFSQEQAAAVYAATRRAERGRVFVSPFVGRLDDRGEQGMDLIAHILRMYRSGDGHVEVLTASVRTIDHFLFALLLGSDIVTAPLAVLTAWAAQGMPLPGADYRYPDSGLRPIPYRDLSLNRPWTTYDIRHELTTRGMEKFSADWNALMSSGRTKAYGTR